jgi:very-short-patch-repair endonuclease
MTETDAARFVVGNGGIVRTSRLAEWGAGRRAIDSAVRQGRLVRPRRGWLAVPDADPRLLLAARHGVVLTCTTQAQALELWVHEAGPRPHVAVDPQRTGRIGIAAKVHWGRPVVPRHPDALVDPIENVLANVAECEPFERALATWDSALNRGLVHIESLARLPFRRAARAVLAEATPFADAGIETYLRPRLRWLRLPVQIQTWVHGHRVDALIGERLALQIDGKHHVGSQRSKDIAHDAELMLLGYHVIRVSYPQVMFGWAAVQDRIMRAVAQGLHRAP